MMRLLLGDTVIIPFGKMERGSAVINEFRAHFLGCSRAEDNKRGEILRGAGPEHLWLCEGFCSVFSGGATPSFPPKNPSLGRC